MSARANILARIRSAQGRAVTVRAEERDAVAQYIAAHPQGPRPQVDADVEARFRDRSLNLATTMAEVKTLADIPAAVARYLRGLNGCPRTSTRKISMATVIRKSRWIVSPGACCPSMFRSGSSTSGSRKSSAGINGARCRARLRANTATSATLWQRRGDGFERLHRAGQMATPLVPSAIANAFHQLTGVRLRQQPLLPERVQQAMNDTGVSFA